MCDRDCEAGHPPGRKRASGKGGHAATANERAKRVAKMEANSGLCAICDLQIKRMMLEARLKAKRDAARLKEERERAEREQTHEELSNEY